MGVRHVVTMKWNDNISDETIAELIAKLTTLPESIGTMTSYSFGPDLGLAEGNFDFAVVADFSCQADWEIYRDHPLHRHIIDELISPNLASRCAVQLRTDG